MTFDISDVPLSYYSFQNTKSVICKWCRVLKPKSHQVLCIYETFDAITLLLFHSGLGRSYWLTAASERRAKAWGHRSGWLVGVQCRRFERSFPSDFLNIRVMFSDICEHWPMVDSERGQCVGWHLPRPPHWTFPTIQKGLHLQMSTASFMKFKVWQSSDIKVFYHLDNQNIHFIISQTTWENFLY